MPSPLIAALRRALTYGGVSVDLGNILGRCGYLDPASRTVILDRDVDDDAWEAELIHDLERLAELVETRKPPDDSTTDLRLVHSTAESGDGDGDADEDGDEHSTPDLGVVG